MVNFAATLLLAHAMTIAAYMILEWLYIPAHRGES